MGTDERDGFGQARAHGGHGMKDKGRIQDWPISKTKLEYVIGRNNCDFWKGSTRVGTE